MLASRWWQTISTSTAPVQRSRCEMVVAMQAPPRKIKCMGKFRPPSCFSSQAHMGPRSLVAGACSMRPTSRLSGCTPARPSPPTGSQLMVDLWSGVVPQPHNLRYHARAGSAR
jgi:hypothetical protein